MVMFVDRIHTGRKAVSWSILGCVAAVRTQRTWEAHKPDRLDVVVTDGGSGRKSPPRKPGQAASQQVHLPRVQDKQKPPQVSPKLAASKEFLTA